VRRIFDSFPEAQDRLRRGEQRIGPPLAEDIEWDASEIALPDLGDGVMRGYEGVRKFWVSWLEAWDDVSFEYSLREAGDKVLVLIHQRNQGTKITLPPMDYAQIWTFADGEVVHWKLYLDQREALRAAGLEGS
jgi:ketosteroid isomerase-like protein